MSAFFHKSNLPSSIEITMKNNDEFFIYIVNEILKSIKTPLNSRQPYV